MRSIQSLTVDNRVVSDQVVPSVSGPGSRLLPFGKALKSPLGFAIAGMRLSSLAHLRDIFVRYFPPHF